MLFDLHVASKDYTYMWLCVIVTVLIPNLTVDRHGIVATTVCTVDRICKKGSRQMRFNTQFTAERTSRTMNRYINITTGSNCSFCVPLSLVFTENAGIVLCFCYVSHLLL